MVTIPGWAQGNRELDLFFHMLTFKNDPALEQLLALMHSESAPKIISKISNHLKNKNDSPLFIRTQLGRYIRQVFLLMVGMDEPTTFVSSSELNAQHNKLVSYCDEMSRLVKFFSINNVHYSPDNINGALFGDLSTSKSLGVLNVDDFLDEIKRSSFDKLNSAKFINKTRSVRFRYFVIKLHIINKRFLAEDRLWSVIEFFAYGLIPDAPESPSRYLAVRDALRSTK